MGAAEILLIVAVVAAIVAAVQENMWVGIALATGFGAFLVGRL
jgi:hypothetical protein